MANRFSKAGASEVDNHGAGGEALSAESEQSKLAGSNNLDELLRLLVAKEAREAAREEEERERKMAAQRKRAEDMERDRMALIEAQDACSHLKENGKPNIVIGQVYSDGYQKPFCQTCGKTATKTGVAPFRWIPNGPMQREAEAVKA